MIVETPTVTTSAGVEDPARDRRLTALKNALPVLITVAAGLLCYGLFVRRSVWLSVVGYSVSPSERVLNGEVPYRDFLYNYTPGTLWFNALLMKLFGPMLLTVNLGVLAFKVATLLAIYFVAKKLIGAWPALIPVALTLAWLGHKYIFGVVPTQYSLLFVVIGASLMISYDRTGKVLFLFLCGAAVGIVLIFKYNVGVLLLASGTAALVIREASAARGQSDGYRWIGTAVQRSAIYWAGFGVVLASLLLYMASTGALGAMVNHFLHHAAEYSEARAVALPRPKQLVPVAGGLAIAVIGGVAMARWSPRLFDTYVVVLVALGCVALLIPGRAYILKQSASATVAYLPLILFAVTAVWLLWLLFRGRRRGEKAAGWWGQYGAIMIVGLFAAGAYLEMYPRADDYHLVRVLPVVFLLLTVFLSAMFVPALRSWLKRFVPGPNRSALMCAMAPLVLLAALGLHNTWRPQFDGRFRFIDRAALPIDRARDMLVPPRQAQFIEGLNYAIEANSEPGDSIFSFAQRGTGFYFLSGRRNPTRFVWWRSVGIDSQDREAVLGMIEARQPKLILLQDSLTNQRVRSTVTSNYHEVAAVTDIRVYARNE